VVALTSKNYQLNLNPLKNWRIVMTINLQEIRTAVINYVDMKVTVSISALTPASGSGTTINPNEEFSFTLTAKNADAASGGIPLKNIIWYVWVENDVVGKLIVPAGLMVARNGPSINYTKLTAGSLVKEMYLFPTSLFLPPADPANYLGVGDTDAVNLKGKAGATPAGGDSKIQFKIYADVDMDWLFPQIQDTSTVTKILNVVG
jgi:hypothetical protein